MHICLRKVNHGYWLNMEQSKGFGGSKVTTHSFNSDDVDIFEPVITETGVLSGRTITFRPISENSSGPYQFNLMPQGPDQCLQLNSIKLGGRIQIMDGDSALADADDYSVVNLFPHSLFRAQEIEINGVLVTDLSSFLSHYQAYIQTILSYNKSAQMTHLKSQLFDMDDAGKFDLNKITKTGNDVKSENNNQAYIRRRAFCKSSKEFDFYSPICSDILQCDRLLHSSANLKIRLLREVDEFSILSETDKNWKIKIKDLKLYAHYVKLSDSLINQHAAKLRRSPMIYPITRTTMKEYTIGSGEKTKYVPNLFTGQLPKSIIIGMVEDNSASGSAKLNPFNFQHFKISESYLKVNGELTPSEPYAPDFDGKIYKREYLELLRNIGIDSSEDHGNAITPDLYEGGAFFMAYDLTGHKCNMLHNHPSQEGNIDLMLQFNETLKKNVRIIVYASSDAQVEIDNAGSVMVRYV